MEQNTKSQKAMHRVQVVVVCLVLLLLALLAGLLAWRLYPRQTPLESAVRAELGQLDGKSDDEIQAELDRVVEAGNMTISINVNPVFATGIAAGTLQIENSPANIYSQNVQITRDDTGELIYESGLIEPNYHIQEDVLLVDLEPGQYPCTATFTAYNTETQAEIGSANAKITITVIG